VKISIDLLAPALDLIARHSPRLDEVETLQILPPLVPAQDIRRFLIEALRAPIFDTRVIRDISKARDEQVAQRLTYLQSKRVKVTDSRM
jgi:Vam6/Vps39-like protein vacuolar protein sorting-associated protein 39